MICGEDVTLSVGLLAARITPFPPAVTEVVMGVCVRRGFKGQSPMLSQKVSPAIAQEDAVPEAP
jgi:hypothetical protein